MKVRLQLKTDSAQVFSCEFCEIFKNIFYKLNVNGLLHMGQSIQE